MSAGGRAPALEVHAVVRRPGFALDARIEVAAGGVLAVLGPNGAGKSTLLRAVAGLVPLDEGTVRLGTEVWDDPASGRFVVPERRGAALVFSDHLLFGHLTVRQNVEFGPRARRQGRRVARLRAEQWLGRLGLEALADRRPAELSGGQAQRVALARALAADPAVLLLDEPMAALDAATRAEVRAAIREHVQGRPGPTVLVTHDPVDATLLADHVAVLDGGAVVQHGTPAELARAPRTPWAAGLLGLNVYRGTADGTVAVLDGGGHLVPAEAPTGRCVVSVAPSALALHRTRPEGSARNVWRAVVTGTEQVGHTVRVGLAGLPDAVADLTLASVTELGLAAGAEVWVSVKATEVLAEPL